MISYISTLYTNQGDTISIDLTYKDDKGNKINLDECEVTFDLLKDKKIVLESQTSTDSILLIPHEISKDLKEEYTIKITINNGGYIENHNIKLIVRF